MPETQEVEVEEVRSGAVGPEPWWAKYIVKIVVAVIGAAAVVWAAYIQLQGTA